MTYDLLIVGGEVVDPVNGRHGVCDVAVADGRVAEVGEELPRRHAARVVEAHGRVVMPGIVDPHMHVSGFGARESGYRMMAAVGVVTALDMGGELGKMAQGIHRSGSGMNVAYLHPLVPRRNLSSPDPDRAEVEREVERGLAAGALGIKILGGHFPVTPEAIDRAIEAARAHSCHVAQHAGSTAAGSNIEGLREAVRIADGRPLHIAHINSYCRGQVTGDPLAEAREAIDLLTGARGLKTESYMSRFNGTGAACRDDVPESHVTRTCLEMGGFAATRRGLREAIEGGWCYVHSISGGLTVLATGAEGLAVYEDLGDAAGLSFPVNPSASTLLLAQARKPDGGFVVDAFSTDGGGIPRNVIVECGLALVRYGAISLAEFVYKAGAAGAALMRLENKGHLGQGADADVTLLDLERGRAVMAVAGGRVIMVEGQVVGEGGVLLTTARGRAAVEGAGLAVRVVRE